MSVSSSITQYEVVIVNDRAGASRFMGWIRLLNGTSDAGYVYITDEPVKPRLGGVGRLPKPYIVMSRPVAEVGVLLTILNDGRRKTIRLEDNDPQSPSAFIEHDGVQLMQTSSGC